MKLKVLAVVSVLALSLAEAQMPIPPEITQEVIEALYTDTIRICEQQAPVSSAPWNACMATELWWISDITWGAYLYWSDAAAQCLQVPGMEEWCEMPLYYATLNYDAAFWFADYALWHWELSQG